MTGILALLALALAAASVWGLQDQISRSRTREFGIRLALGARPSRVIWEAVRTTLGAALLGLLAGVVVGLEAEQWAQHYKFGLAGVSPAGMAFSAALLLLLAVAGSLGPALRAGRLDVAVALRDE